MHINFDSMLAFFVLSPEFWTGGERAETRTLSDLVHGHDAKSCETPVDRRARAGIPRVQPLLFSYRYYKCTPHTKLDYIRPYQLIGKHLHIQVPKDFRTPKGDSSVCHLFKNIVTQISIFAAMQDNKILSHA